MQLRVAPPSPYSIWQAKYLSRNPWVHMPDTMDVVHAESPTKVAGKVADKQVPKNSVVKAAEASVVLKNPRRMKKLKKFRMQQRWVKTRRWSPNKKRQLGCSRGG